MKQEAKVVYLLECLNKTSPPVSILLKSLRRAKKIICGFPVSRPYLAFGRRNPDPKLFYWIMLVSVST